MKKNYLYMAALALLTAACSNEDEFMQEGNQPTPGVNMITETIKATNGDANGTTRADISNDTPAAFTWSAGDQIAVHVSNGKYYTATLTSGASTNEAEFTAEYPEGKERDAFAIYPASIVAESATNYGQSSTSLDVTLPNSYTLAQVSGTTSPCPMIATNTPGSGWTFSQLCGLLRLTVKSIPSDATGIVIQFPGKKVNGAFSIASPANPGSSTIMTGTPATGEDCITVTFDAGTTEATVNIPLPTGAYEDVYITPMGSATEVAAARYIKAGGYTATRAHARKLTTTMVCFSISDTKKVFFSPGNLVKTDNTYEVGSGNESYVFESVPFNTNGGSLGYGQGTPTATSARGYFTWYEIISDGTTSESPRLFTVNGVSGWRAMTYDEWDYLCFVDGRQMNNGVARYYRIDLGNDGKQIGFLLPPDGATSNDVSDLTAGQLTENVNIDTYISKGFVFLPAAGFYPLGWYNYWDEVGERGYYWYTTEEDDDCATFLRFHVAGQGDDSGEKSYYCSVRLIHD